MLVTESALSIPSATLAPRRYTLYIEALKSRSFSRQNLTSAHAEGGDFLRSQVTGRGSSCDKIRPDHPLNGLLVNDGRGLIVEDLTGRKSKPVKGDLTNVELIKV